MNAILRQQSDVWGNQITHQTFLIFHKLFWWSVKMNCSAAWFVSSKSEIKNSKWICNIELKYGCARTNKQRCDTKRNTLRYAFEHFSKWTWPFFRLENRYDFKLDFWNYFSGKKNLHQLWNLVLRGWFTRRFQIED